MLIYKIFREPEWRLLQDEGDTEGAPIDVTDGFIHFSTAEQVPETAAKWFEAVNNLWLVAFDSETMGEALKWEPSRGGALFPHLFRRVKLEEVIWAKRMPWTGTEHDFPEDMS